MRYTSSFLITGTKSFRLASRKLLDHYGGNAQNPSEPLMRCLVAGPGRKFVQVDQAGAESLVVAYEARDGRYRQLIHAGIKQHVYIALHVFINDFRGEFPKSRYWMKQPAELKALPEWKDLVKKIKNDSTRYYIGKKTNHMRSYLAKWPTFQLSVLQDTEGKLVLTKEEAQYYLNTWDDLFPEVVNWQTEFEVEFRKTRTLQNLFGYQRQFFGKMDDSLVREAISWIPQSTIGCLTHQAVCNTLQWIEENDKDWSILNNKHDSFLLNVPEAEASEAAKVMQRFTEIELTSTSGERYTMKSEASIGDNWAKYDEETNPHGMREVVA